MNNNQDEPSMYFLKETMSQYKKDKNQKDLADNLSKYKEIQSKEEKR